MAKYPLALFLLVFYASFSFAQVEDSLPERGMMLNPELSIAPEPGPILSSVELQRQKIYKSLDKALVDPSKVYRLDLSGQKYREFPPQIFRLINLQELILSGNKLKEIPTDIHKLQNLELLVLTQNKLRTLPEEMKEMGNLSRLYVGENRLMTVPAWVGGLAKLRYLDLHGNYITLYEVSKIQERLPNCEIGFK